MTAFPNLDEFDTAPEMVDHPLIPLVFPPFDGEVGLASGDQKPERRRFAHRSLYLLKPRLLGRGEVNVTPKLRRLDAQAELVVEVVDESVQEVIGRGVADVD